MLGLTLNVCLGVLLLASDHFGGLHSRRTKSVASSDAAAASSGPLVLLDYSCCCRRGACKSDEIGVRSRPSVWHPERNICCMEVGSGIHKSCNSNLPIEQDVDMCVPEEVHQKEHTVRRCRAAGLTNHQFLQFSDGGCARLMLENGGFESTSHFSEYKRMDCPFADNVDKEMQARRSLLIGFHVAKPASYVDVMWTCAYQWLWLDEWKFLQSYEPLNSVLTNLLVSSPDSYQAFICETLQLLPLLWPRVGFTNDGINEDPPPHSLTERYPRSFLGHKKANSSTHKYLCHQYSELPRDQSAHGRRALRALLPTYGTHGMASGTLMLGAEMTVSLLPQKAFTRELKLACDFREDVEFVRTPMALIQNKDVLSRDRTTCSKTFPCRYTQPSCVSKTNSVMYQMLAEAGGLLRPKARTCSCECYEAICAFFVADFVQTVAASQDVCRKVVFEIRGSGEKRINGDWALAGRANGRDRYSRIGNPQLVAFWDSTRWVIQDRNLFASDLRPLYVSEVSEQMMPQHGWKQGSGNETVPDVWLA